MRPEIVVGAEVVVTGEWTPENYPHTHSAEGNDTVYTVTGFHGRFAALSDGKNTYAWPTDLLELAPLEDLAARLDEKWGTGAGEQVTT